MDHEAEFNRLLELWGVAKERERKAMLAISPLFAATASNRNAHQPTDAQVDEYNEAVSEVWKLQQAMSKVIAEAFPRR
jgi:hypothetical protein